MKLPIMLRKTHDRLLADTTAKSDKECKTAVKKARIDQDKAVYAYMKARWEHGMNQDGSRPNITFDKLMGKERKKKK